MAPDRRSNRKGFARRTRDDAAVDIVLLARGTEVLPGDQRDQRAAGLILAFTGAGIEDEEVVSAEVTIGAMTPPHGESLAERFETLASLREEARLRV
jgi:hypothetical protein